MAWPFLVSEFLRVIEVVLGLVTCEKCMSSVTRKTTECLKCAVSQCVDMDTQLPSQYAKR